MATPESKSAVRQVERALSKHRPEPIPIERVTYKQVITLLVKHDEIKEAKYWLDNSDEPNDKDSKDTQDKFRDRRGDDKNGNNNLSRKEKRARHDYARTNRKKWSEVRMEMINNDGGVQHWADRNTNSIQTLAHTQELQQKPRTTIGQQLTANSTRWGLAIVATSAATHTAVNKTRGRQKATKQFSCTQQIHRNQNQSLTQTQ